MDSPPLMLAQRCRNVDRYHRQLPFVTPHNQYKNNLTKTVSKANNLDPGQQSLRHSNRDLLHPRRCRLPLLPWFEANFEIHKQNQESLSLSQNAWNECTIRLHNCDPETFELYMNWHYTGRIPIPIIMSDEYYEEYEAQHADNENDHFPGDDYEDEYVQVVGEDVISAEDEEAREDYYKHAMLFMAKAYVLGRKAQDGYFQKEVDMVMQELRDYIMRAGGFARGMIVIQRAGKILTEEE